jgi:two-component system, sensor histidine kinase LadS
MKPKPGLLVKFLKPPALLGVFILLLVQNLEAQQLALKDKAVYRFDADTWSYITDPAPEDDITQVMTKFKEGQFIPGEARVLNAGIAQHPYWIHFKLRNETGASGSFAIEIENPRLNHLALYEVSATSLTAMEKLGDWKPFNSRPVKYKNFIYTTNLGQHESKSYFLFVRQTGNSLTVPIKVYKAETFWTTRLQNYLFDGVTYGILLFVTILSLLFFVNTRHYLYLYYSLYVLTAIAWFLTYFGLGFQYIWPGYPDFNTPSSPVIACLNIALNIQICKSLLKLRKANLLLFRLGNIFQALLLVIGVLPLLVNLNRLGYTENKLYFSVFLAIIIISMVIVFLSVIFHSLRGSVVARFYFVTSLLKVYSIITLAMLELDMLPAAYDTEGKLQAGILIEITLLTYAIAKRYTFYRFRSFQQVIKAQEGERKEIAKDIHDSISNTLTGIRYAFRNMMSNNNGIDTRLKNEMINIADKISEVQYEARYISHNMMPDYIKHKPITVIVQQYISEVQERIEKKEETKERLKINFSSNEQTVNFPEEVKLNIFRIVQELVGNIIKHSEATTAELIFSFEKRKLKIIAEDNGLGFEEANEKDATGIGLKSIRSRVHLMDGTFHVKSPAYSLEKNKRPDHELSGAGNLHTSGTMILIDIPYRNNLVNKNSSYDF